LEKVEFEKIAPNSLKIAAKIVFFFEPFGEKLEKLVF